MKNNYLKFLKEKYKPITLLGTQGLSTFFTGYGITKTILNNNEINASKIGVTPPIIEMQLKGYYWVDDQNSRRYLTDTATLSSLQVSSGQATMNTSMQYADQITELVNKTLFKN